MPRLSTCKMCGKKLQPEEKCTHNGKTYCLNCGKQFQIETDEYKKLIEFICTAYEIDRPTGLMLKQIKTAKTENNWSYAAMTYTLWYAKEILDKPYIEKYGVYQIKNFYEDARQYYSKQEKMKERMSKIKDVEIKTKIVKSTNSSSDNQKSSLINFTDLLKDGGDN